MLGFGAREINGCADKPTMRLTHANLSSIGKAGQRALSRSCIGLAGLGGVGGIAFELLVRAGVGKIKIADGGFFEESNANRQSLWSKSADGARKTRAAENFAKEHGAACILQPFGEITPRNAAAFAKGCSAVIDATDTPSSRLAVLSGCARSRVPCIFASARGERAMLSVFPPEKIPEGRRLMGAMRGHESCDHALGPVANAAGCLAAQQAINIVLKKPILGFPQVLSLDAFSGEIATVHRF